MKRWFFLFFLPLYAERCEVDRIKVTIYGPTETILITQSEVDRPALDGQPKTFDDLLFEFLVYLDAKRINAIPSAQDVDRYWEEVKRQNNLSEQDMQNIALQAGYTLSEAKAQLGRMSAISQMLDMKVKSGLFVSKREVQAYYDAYPEVQQAEYYISFAVVPFSDLEPKEAMKERLCDYARTGKGDVRIAWGEPFWLLHEEIAADKQFIYTMKAGQIALPRATRHGFEMIKLVSKKPERLVPLSERYDEIEMLLKRPKYEQLLEKYKAELKDKATIVYH